MNTRANKMETKAGHYGDALGPGVGCPGDGLVPPSVSVTMGTTFVAVFFNHGSEPGILLGLNPALGLSPPFRPRTPFARPPVSSPRKAFPVRLRGRLGGARGGREPEANSCGIGSLALGIRVVPGLRHTGSARGRRGGWRRRERTRGKGKERGCRGGDNCDRFPPARLLLSTRSDVRVYLGRRGPRQH